MGKMGGEKMEAGSWRMEVNGRLLIFLQLKIKPESLFNKK